MALLALGALRAASASAADSPLSYVCDPPFPRAQANCSMWHTSTVTLNWIFDAANYDAPGANEFAGSNCNRQTFDADTTGTNVRCAITDAPNHTSVFATTATIRLDKTPPTVSGFTPDRP